MNQPQNIEYEHERTVSEDRFNLSFRLLFELDYRTGCKGGEHGAGQLEAVEAIGRGGASVNSKGSWV